MGGDVAGFTASARSPRGGSFNFHTCVTAMRQQPWAIGLPGGEIHIQTAPKVIPVQQITDGATLDLV